MNLEAIAAKIAELEPTLIVGENLFVHGFPPDVEFGAMLRLAFGGTDLDHELPGYIKAEFQFIVRGRTYDQTVNIAKSVQEKLNLYNATITGITKVNYIRPKMEPFIFPTSPGHMWEALVNFEVCYLK
jgi:hypothetical protein